MAIDSRDKRAAGVGFVSPSGAILPTADATVGQLSDRQIVTFGYPIIGALGVYVEPHRYLFWSGSQVTESDMRYMALVDGVDSPSAATGYGIVYINGDGNVHLVDEDGNDRIFVTSEGVITSDTTVANTVTETTVYTETVPADELHVGRVMKVRILGYYSTVNGVDTFTARLKVGGTTVDTVTSDAGVVSNAQMDVEFLFTVRSVGATGTVIGYVAAEFNNTSKSIANTSTTTIDTTAADDVTLTVQWSNADAGNTLTITQGFAELLG